MHPDDLSTFTRLSTGKVTHRQAIGLAKPFSDVRLALEIMFEGVDGAGHMPVKSGPSPTSSPGRGEGQAGKQQDGGAAAAGPSYSAAAGGVGGGGEAGGVDEVINVSGLVTVRYKPGVATAGYDSHVLVEWQGGSKGDLVADAVIAVILQAGGEPPGASAAEEQRRKALAAEDEVGAAAAEMALLAALLRAQFGDVVVNDDLGMIKIVTDGVEVVVDHFGRKVSCPGNEALRVRVEKVVDRVMEAMQPCVMDFED
jgi:cleavage and polyadenylation specificity factor subunit 3